MKGSIYAVGHVNQVNVEVGEVGMEPFPGAEAGRNTLSASVMFATPDASPLTRDVDVALRRIQLGDPDRRGCARASSGASEPAEPNLNYYLLTQERVAPRGWIVLLAGAQHDARFWLSEVAPSLAIELGWNVAIPEYRGHGKSGLPEDRPSSLRHAHLTDYCEDTLRCLAHAGVAPAHAVFVGHGMGFFVAWKLALETPVAGLYALASVAPKHFLRSLLPFEGRFLARHPTLWFKTTILRRPQLFCSQAMVAEFLVRCSAYGPDDRATGDAVATTLWRQLQDAYESPNILWDVIRIPRQSPSLGGASPGEALRFVASADDQMLAESSIRRSAREYGGQYEVLLGAPHDAALGKSAQSVVRSIHSFAEGIYRRQASQIAEGGSSRPYNVSICDKLPAWFSSMPGKPLGSWVSAIESRSAEPVKHMSARTRMFRRAEPTILQRLIGIASTPSPNRWVGRGNPTEARTSHSQYCTQR